MDRFCADLHLGHANVIRYCSRPYPNVLKMDEDIIARWNAVVRPDDHTYILGDFCLPSGYPHVARYLRLLNGTKALITGNHDKKNHERLIEAGFAEVFNGNPAHGGLAYHDAVLVHQPPDEAQWATMQAHGAKLCFHGHVHDAWVRRGHLVNVGADVRAFTPQSYEELIK